MKLLANFSVIAVLATVALVLTGQMTAAKKALSPGSDAAENAVRSTVGKSQSSANLQLLAVLYKEANLERVSGTSDLNARAMTQALRASEPAARVGDPVSRGGVALRWSGADTIELCVMQLAGRVFTCARGRVAPGGELRFASAATLKGARARLRAATSKAPAASAGPDGGAGTAGKVLQRARELPVP